ncbi:MAG: hypothetical protein IPI67_20115 [Myxococcales bacterium]|nr:hypothetical protein [Myxococcales bacterium]
MLGASELDAAFIGIVLLEGAFVAWLMARSRREPGAGLVHGAVRLGMQASRRRV